MDNQKIKVFACRMWSAGLQRNHSGIKDYYCIEGLEEVRNKHSEVHCPMNQYSQSFRQQNHKNVEF